MLTHPCLVQGLACDSHCNKESLLLLMRDSDDDMSHITTT
jgi:hypothetical protein